MKSPPSGVTLLELIISLSLVLIVILGISRMEFFSRFQVLTSSRNVLLQNEASLVLEYISRDFVGAIGDVGDPNRGVNHDPVKPYSDQSGFKIRKDGGDGQISSDDYWVGYRYANHQILYYPNDPGEHLSASEVLANHIIALDADSNKSGFAWVWVSPQINQLQVTIRSRWKPDDTTIASDNPEVVMQSTIVAPGVSSH